MTIIQDSSFSHCIGLKSVIIPNTVTHIEYSAFDQCLSLTSIAIPNSVISIGDWAFAGSGLTSVTIPNSVTSIRDMTFYATSLTKVTIPNSVTNLGNFAFSTCHNLRSIYFQGSPPQLGTETFTDDLNLNLTLYYLPNATNGWTNPFGGRPTKLWSPTFGTLNNVAGVISCTITGAPTIPVGLEVSSNLTTGPWIRLYTSSLDGAGTYTFTDTDATNKPVRFYRMVGP